MPDKYFIDSNKQMRLVPEGKEDRFLSKFPGAREATRKELTDFEDKSSKNRELTQRESNISNDQGNSAPKTPANKPLNGFSPSFVPNKFDFPNTDYTERFNDKEKVSISSGKSLDKSVSDAMKNVPVSTDGLFNASVSKYKQESDWIKDIQNNPDLSDSVKQQLVDDYNSRIRTNNTTIEDKDLPPAAKEWLANNKQPVEKRVWIPSNKSLGESGYFQKHTVYENTPEQIDFIKDYIANSTEGQHYARVHKEWIQGLESEIEPLIKQGNEIIKREVNNEQKAVNDTYSQRGGRNPNFPNDKLQYANENYTLANKAVSLLENAKSLLSANKDGNGFWKGIKPSAGEVGDFLAMSEFLSDERLNSVIDKYEKDPNSLTPEENLAIQAKYVADQITAGVDPGSWYNIGQSTKQSASFMRDFIMTAPIGGAVGNAVKSGVSALAGKTGANLLLSRGIGGAISKTGKAAIDLSVRPAVQTMFSPSSYAMALQEMEGQAVDRDEQGNIKFDNRKDFSLVSPFIENQSEVLGEVVLDKLFQKFRLPIPAFLKTKTAQRISAATGIQGPISEFTEEKYSDLINVVRGEQTIEGFLDPRSNLETFGAVAVMQIPFTAIKSTGYGIGKIRDIQGKRALRQAYDKSSSNILKEFGQEGQSYIESVNATIDSGNDISGLMLGFVNSENLSDNQKRAIVEYSSAYSAYSGVKQAKEERANDVKESITQNIIESSNKDTNEVISAKLNILPEEVNITGGAIVYNEDGTIDKDKSSEIVYYIDPADGKKKPISINDIEEITNRITSDDLINNANNAITQAIDLQEANEEAPEFTMGDRAIADVNGNKIEGVISQVNPDGYIIRFDDGTTIPIQPYQLSEIETPEMEEDISNSQDQNDISAQNEQNVTTHPSEQNNLSYIEQIPQNESGSLLFEQVPVETTIGALNEVYSDAAELSGVVDATISNIGKQIDKAKSPKPTGDITKDIANKQKANQQIEELNNRLSYWQDVRNSIQQSRPIEQRVTEQLTGEETPTIKLDNEKKPKTVNRNTPFQRRLNAVEENVHTIRDRILFGIASGAYKFRWKDKGVSMGLARELGLSGSEAERKARIGLLSNNGYTPSTLAHRIWEETGGELNDNDIRSEIIDVLNSVSSRKQALETLENNAGITEEQYQQQQTEASEYELKLRAQEEVNLLAIIEQQSNETLLSLEEEALSLGATSEQLQDVQTSTDFIDLIEQLQDGQQEQTSNEGRSETETSNNNSEGNETDSTQRAVSERNRSEESTGDSRQDSDSTGNGINLSPEEQRVVNEATAQIDAEIAEAQPISKEINPRDIFQNRLREEFPNGLKLYHRTTPDNWESIKSDGLINASDEVDGVHTTLGNPNIDRVGGANSVLLEINVPVEDYNNLYPEDATYYQDFEGIADFENYDMIFDTYMKAHPDMTGGDIIYAGNVPINMVSVYNPSVSEKILQESYTPYNFNQEIIDWNREGAEGVFPLADDAKVSFSVRLDSFKPYIGVMVEGVNYPFKLKEGFSTTQEAKEYLRNNKEEIDNLWWDMQDILEKTPTKESIIESSNDIRIVEYSDKSIAVYGDNTKEIKDQLKAIGGRFNPKLRDGAGWIFPKSKEGDVRALIDNSTETSTTPTISEVEDSTPTYGASNTVFSQSAYEEAKKKLRDKLSNFNAGFDPEMILLSTQVAGYHIESGVRKLADLASKMIEDLGDSIRPFIKGAYESVRYYPGMEEIAKEMDDIKYVMDFDIDNLTTFDKESNTSNNNSNETNSDNRSDNSITEDGGTSTGITDADVRERTASTQTDGRAQSEQRPTMETKNVEQRRGSDRDGGNNDDSSGTELHSGGTERNANNGRKDTGDTEQSGKPLNTNNNKQSREENVVPRGNAAKINANITAIKLAKRLTETGKKATPEQMSVLRRYTGWGGLSSVFQQNDKNYKVLQDLLTEEEYDSARASTTTAFYTPSEVTASVWDMIEKLGFKGGNILEPSAGIGNFFALMPENISNVSQLRGVELDTVSGSILKLLYPDANINISGFEKQRIANNSMDLVVSNVPFGNFKVYDSNNKDISNQFDIHDYFIAKSVRTLKAGGIGVFITTSSTLDKSSALRNWLINNGNADFIDAVRLNTDTFKNDAGTEATADIIIVRKRDVNGISPYSKNMQDSVIDREATYTIQEKDRWGYNVGEVEKKARMVYNKYFLDNPIRMAGEMKFGFEGGNVIRPAEQRLAPVKAINQKEVINQMIDELPSNIYNTIPADKTSKAIANNGTKEGGLTVIDGQAYIIQYNEAVPVEWNSNKAGGYSKEEILQDYLDIKEGIELLLEAEHNNDANIATYRKNLNKVYDSFVNKYGTLNENRKINFLQDDIDFPSVAAIENIEDANNGEKTISKSDIFSKRAIDNQIEPKADNIEDAVRVSMNQNGKVDIPYIAQLLDKANEEVQSEIVKKRIGFLNPETGLVESRNQYLSGNVRDKLSIAQQANQENEYDSNIEELSKVIPADIPINLIKLTLGSTWVPINVYEDFFKETFDVGAQFTRTSTDKYIGKFSRKDNAKDVQMGMSEASGSTLALNSMNNTTTTISMLIWEDGKRKSVTDPVKTAQAAAKQTEIAEAFEAWVKQNKKYHEELENIYNNTFNAVINSKIDVDSFDRFPGVGGKVVSLGSKVLDNGKEIYQFRVAKENTEADNELVAKEAKSLGLKLDPETGIYSTHLRGDADTFFKKLNGTSKILRQHQKEGVIRGLESATLLAHEVGTGKTLTLITTAMEMRRLGLAKKPTIVVQRSTYKQFVKEIKNQYPNAKVLAPSAKDLTAKQREQLFAKIAYNDWDIVVLYHSYLDSIPDDPQRVAQYIDEKIQEKMDLLDEMERAKEDGAANAGRMMGALKKEIERLERDRDNTLSPDIEDNSEGSGKSKRKRSVKDIEKVRSNTEAKAEKSLDRRTDNTMTFEQLGIDALLVDEAHAYKKLGFVTSLQRVKGIDTAESKRAQSTKLKTSYILENHNGKNVVLATGTPISNTMAEMWTFMRYLYPRTEMGRLQMNNFDAFVNNFGSIEESAEFGSNGKFRITNRFSSYSNVPELIAAWRQVAHTVLTEEVSTLKEGVGTPRVEGGKPADIMLEQTPPLKSVMKAIKNKLEEFDRMSGAEKKENSHIPLVMFGLAKRAAIDVRLVDPNLPDHPQSKLNQVVRDILQALKETESYKGTIAIFCDSYQSSDKRFNVFKDIKQKLIDKGISPEQIAIINEYDTDIAKEKLFDLINRGEVRVVMGTTEKLGVGVNIQERLFMAGHMDAPLRPSDYQQRNGRIIRQGNTHLNMDKPVRLMRWGVQKTLDVTGYQRLEIKKKFIDQIMKGDVSQRMLEEADIESTDSSNFNQMMANLSGSQAALALSIEQNKLKKLLNAKQYHEDNQVYIAGAVRRAKGIIVGNGQAIERFEAYKNMLNKLIPTGKVTDVSIGKVSANTPEDIEAVLTKYVTKRVDKEVADLREDFNRNSAKLKTSISVSGIKIDLEIEINRNYDAQTNKTRVTREIHYTTPDHTIENPHSSKNEIIPLFDGKAGANVLNVLEEINDLLSGYDADREIQRYKIGIDKAQRDIDAFEPQIGQSFAKENELRATEEKVEDLNVQMEVELKQIEDAESKEDIEAIDISEIVEKSTDDNSDDDPTSPNGGGRRQTSSSGDFQNIPAEKFDQLIDTLNQTGLAVDIVLEENLSNNAQIKDAQGDVYGYVTPEGVIHLDATRMNANTPIHEFGHLWNSFIKENNPELYNRGVELIKQSPYWERVNNNPDYSSLSKERKEDEALAMAYGDKGEAITNRSLKQQFIDWLSEVWQSIKEAFGINTNIPLSDMTLSDFTDRAVQDLLSGNKLTESPVIYKEIKSRSYLNSSNPADVKKPLDSDTNIINNLENDIRLQSVNSPLINVDYDGNIGDYIEVQSEANNIAEHYRKFDLSIKNGKARRAFVDQYQPLESLQKTVEAVTKKSIQEHENAYMSSQMVQSLDSVQMDIWNSEYMNPIYTSIKSIITDNVSEENIHDYMKVKHGLERNRRLREKKGIDAENIEVDLSGIFPILERGGYELNDNGAESFISDFENIISKESADNLWQSIKEATNHILDISYDSGLTTKGLYNELKSRNDFYIPLRGWQGGTVADLNDYPDNMFREAFQSILKVSEGRESEADNPIAFIKMMGESEIMRGNKNKMKQSLLNMVRNHKTPALYSVNRIYEILDYNPQTREETWTEVDYKPDQDLFEQGLAREIRSGHQFEKPITPYILKEHQVVVYEMGEKYIITFTNPAVALSVNGMLNQSKADNTWISWASGVNRFMSAAYTKWNPEFFLYTNFVRDYGMANVMHLANNDARYTINFNKHIPFAMKAYYRAMFGEADLNNEYDRNLKEFIDNGGETGFAVLKDLDKTKAEIERIMRGKKSLYEKFEDNTLLKFLEKLGRITEGTTRFATYLASRQDGRSVKQSIIDAKNATVNFNKRGSGETIKISDLNIPLLQSIPFVKDMPISARFFQVGYVFFNASIQGVDVVYQTAKRNKIPMAIIGASFYAAGAILSLLCRMMMGDDDELGLSEYDKIPQWIRQNNIIIPTGSKSYISIPLPQIFRGMYGMGEMTSSYLSGNMKGQNLGYEMLGAVSDDLSPVDMGSLIRYKNDKPYFSGAVPTMIKPLVEAFENIDYLDRPIAKQTEYNNHIPEFRRVYNRTGKQWVLFSELLNKASGGDNVQKGIININPAKVEHIMQNYFGGLLKFSDKSLARMYDVGKILSGEDVSIDNRDIPLFGKVFGASSKRVGMSNYYNRFYEYVNRSEELKRQSNEYLKLMDYSGYNRFMEKNQNEILLSEFISAYNSSIKKIRKAESTLDNDSKKDVLGISDQLIIEAVTQYEQLNNTRNDKDN